MCNATFSRIAMSASLLIVLCAGATAREAAPGTPSESPNDKTFLWVQRTKGHVKYSSADVFHNVVSDLNSYLETHHVSVARDEFGGRDHAESEVALNAVVGIARDAGAKYILYFVVDRPFSKWIKVTVRAYDVSGKQLWQAESSSGGGLSGGHGLRVTLERLHAELDRRLGEEGLPLLPTSSEGIHQPGPATR